MKDESKATPPAVIIPPAPELEPIVSVELVTGAVDEEGEL